MHAGIHLRIAASWKTGLIALGVALLLGASTHAGDVLFSAKLSEKDHFNSSGQRLTSVAAIIQQDRANYHKWNKRDPEDQPDGGLFSSSKARAQLGEDLAKVKISDSLRKKILNGTPVIYVGMADDNSLVIGLKDW